MEVRVGFVFRVRVQGSGPGEGFGVGGRVKVTGMSVRGQGHGWFSVQV